MGAIIDATKDLDHSQAIRDGRKQGWEMVILPLHDNNLKMIVKRIDDSLNLTCKIQHNPDDESLVADELRDKRFKLSWQVNSLQSKR